MLRKAASGMILFLLLTISLATTLPVQPANSEAVSSVDAGKLRYSRISNPGSSTANAVLIWTVSPTNFGALYVMPGESVDLVVTISNDQSSNATWVCGGIGFGWWWGDRGDYEWVESPPPVDPGDSWTGTIGRFTVFAATPWGTHVTVPGCSMYVKCSNPDAQPFEHVIPVTIIAGPAPPISIHTDQYEYQEGDAMYLGLYIDNPVAHPITVCVAVWLEKPIDPIMALLYAHAVTLPGNFSYSNPSFRTFVLPSIPSGNYTWHAALLNPSTHAILIEDTAEWEFS